MKPWSSSWRGAWNDGRTISLRRRKRRLLERAVGKDVSVPQLFWSSCPLSVHERLDKLESTKPWQLNLKKGDSRLTLRVKDFQEWTVSVKEDDEREKPARLSPSSGRKRKRRRHTCGRRERGKREKSGCFFFEKRRIQRNTKKNKKNKKSEKRRKML